MWKSRDCLRGLLKKYTETFLANTSDLKTQQKVKNATHHEKIELNFDASSCQQILGLESKILWEARITPTLCCVPILLVHLLSEGVPSREDTFLSWHLAPVSEVTRGPF
jgi:hypothetical protein